MKADENTPQSQPPVTLYDQHGNPVQVHPQHIQQAASPQSDNSPSNDWRQSQTTPQMGSEAYDEKAVRQFDKQVNTSSHVTQRPDQYEGHDFNPQVRSQYANEPNVVHSTRPVEPDPLEVSDELKQLHDESAQKYPNINLSSGEYVLHEVTRHPIGLFTPLAISGGLILVIVAVLFSYPFLFAESGIVSFAWLTAIAIGLILLIAVFGYIAVWVYLRNRLILTNESVIQEIQHSLFSKHEQTVSLGSVEDASFKQNGIIEMAFNYGSIRLSTEGEETTYRFYYVENPKRQVAILTNAVEAFKNGRPVTNELLQ